MQSRPHLQAAFNDLVEGVRRWELWGTMGWYDVRQNYRRSVLGPFWLTLSLAVMVGVLGLLYGGLFGFARRDYVPYLTVGLIFWAFIASCMTDGCTVFTRSAHFIQQVNAPLSIHVFRLLWKDLIVLLHNAIVYVAILVVFGIWPGSVALLALPGFFAIYIIGFSASMVLGVLAARFRDIPPIVTSVVQIVFFVSPILWMPQQIQGRAMFLEGNPLFHLLNIVRQPLLGEVPSFKSWIFVLGLMIIGVALAALLFVRFRRRIPYWV
jgi:ABC-2 type transport system permease protein/lipopolysaccharide transport system permease protein